MVRMVRESEMLQELGIRSDRLKDVFKGSNDALEVLIYRDGMKNCRINIDLENDASPKGEANE